MKKRAIIIHGWESAPDQHWYIQEKVALEEMGYEVEIPAMPGGSFPIEEEWVAVIANLKPDNNTVLVGHSLGVPAILRFLEKANVVIDRAFLIAGFASPLDLDYPNADYPTRFVDHDFSWELIKQKSSDFLVYNQLDDPWVPISKGKELASHLNVELIEVPGDNHFDTMDLSLLNEEL